MFPMLICVQGAAVVDVKVPTPNVLGQIAPRYIPTQASQRRDMVLFLGRERSVIMVST